MTEYIFREEGCTRCGTEDVEVVQIKAGAFEAKFNKLEYDEDGNQYLCPYCYETNLSKSRDIPDIANNLVSALHILERRLREKPNA